MIITIIDCMNVTVCDVVLFQLLFHCLTLTVIGHVLQSASGMYVTMCANWLTKVIFDHTD